MIRSHPIRRRTAARSLVACALLDVAAFALPALIAHAAAATGHWSPEAIWSQDNPERYAVHMMLLRGDSDPYHSRVLWWQGEAQIHPSTETIFYGGEWGWTPGDDDCATYPTAHFVPIGVDTSGMNPFCGSHMMLGDGRVLMAGGHNPFISDYGDNRVRIFKDSTGTKKGAWSVAHDMNYWRWYPTATALRDSRAVLVSGNQYRQHQTFGGKRNGSAPATPTGDSLYRFAPIPGGRWDPAILPDSAAGNLRPTPRYAHSAIAAEHVNPFNAQVYFGGRMANGTPLDDTWFQRIDYSDQLRRDPRYAWEKPTIAGGPPLPRSDHTASVALDTCMVVFGGLGASTTFGDAWRLFYDSSVPPSRYRWSPIETDSTPPNLARFGHGAIYDTTIRSSAPGDTLRRMIVFGGTSAEGQPPTDSKVWELRFSSSNPSSGTWHEMPQDTLGSDGGPSPRYWHTMNVDRNDRVLGTRGICHVAFMFGGTLDTGACSDTLWKLWIFKNGHVGWEKVLPVSSTVPGARARHSAILDTHQSGYGGRLYVFGGVTANGQPADARAYVLDPWGGKYSSWAQGCDLGTSLAGQTALLDDDQQYARTAEVYDPGTDRWTALSSATMRQQSYPPVFLVPGGSNGASRMITINNNSLKTYALDIPASGQSGGWQKLTNGSLDLLPQGGVLYRPDRIMIAGGQDSSTRLATGKTRTLNTSSLGNQWGRSGGDMVPRQNANLVLLPTGNVLAVGGNQTGVSGSPIKRPQMWSLVTDSTGVWSSATDPANWLEEQPTIRPHHSTAILLPDGRVLSAGGDGDQSDPNSDQHTADIFCPPYLFKADGNTLAVRPAISDAAAGVGWGKVFTVCVTDTALIRRACLVRPGATTHAFDQNQRYVPLNFTAAASPPRLFVTSPASPDSAPPGDYMLFITGSADGADVPSIAKWVRLGPAGRDTCDTVRPRNITNLAFDVDPDDCTRFLLTWTAPGDDSSFVASGRATQYDLKISNTSITTDWTPGSPLSRLPSSAGATDSAYVTVGFGQSKYFRIKTKDDNALWSGISNQVHISGPPSGSDCSEGGGSFAGGGGGGGERARPVTGALSLQGVGAAWSGENTLLNGVRRGTRAGDLLRLPGGAAAGASAYSVRIREATGHAMKLEDVRLLTVDHSPSATAFVASGKPVLGTQVGPVRATDGTGSDVTARVDGSTPDAFVGDSGAVIVVELSADSAVTPDPVVIEASGLGWFSSGVLLQVPDRANGWRTAAQLHPRLYFDQLGVDSIAAAKVRLVLLGRHQIRFVGRMTRSSEPPTFQWAELVRAQGGRTGDALSALTASDTASVILVGPDTLYLSFAPPPLAEGQVRECFLAVDATPLSLPGLTASQLRAIGAASVPTRFALWQNQPNPFSAATSIRFDLPVGAMVRLEVFDVQGRRVKVGTNHYYPAGYQAVQWDRRDEGGGTARPSVYLYRLTAGSFRAQRKMVLLP